MRTHGIRTTLLRMEGAGKTARAANMVRFRLGIHPLSLSRTHARTSPTARGDRARAASFVTLPNKQASELLACVGRNDRWQRI